MIVLTKEQRKALKQVFDRGPILEPPRHYVIDRKPITYLQFRRRVVPCFDGSGCVLVPWVGVWLGIERDGYTHS